MPRRRGVVVLMMMMMMVVVVVLVGREMLGMIRLAQRLSVPTGHAGPFTVWTIHDDECHRSEKKVAGAAPTSYFFQMGPSPP